MDLTPHQLSCRLATCVAVMLLLVGAGACATAERAQPPSAHDTVELDTRVERSGELVAPAITAPMHDARLAGTVSLTATVPEHTAVTRVTWLLDQNPLTTVTAPPWSATLQTSDIDDGPHVLLAKAGDARGHWATSSAVGVWIDNDATKGEVDTAFTRGPRATNLVAPTFEFASQSPAASFTCQLDDRGWMPCSSPLTLPELDEGTHRLAVTAASPTGQADPSPAEVSFVIDTQGPAIAVSAPAQAEPVSGTIALIATASDSSAVTAVRWYVNGVEAAYDGDGEPWSRPWNSATVANGRYRVFAKARDVAGNWATSPVVDFVVDN